MQNSILTDLSFNTLVFNSHNFTSLWCVSELPSFYVQALVSKCY